MADVKLSLADQAFVNAMLCIAIPKFVFDVAAREQDDMVIEFIRELMPQINYDHPLVEPLAVAAEEVLDFFDAREAGFRTSANVAARCAANRFAFWRVAMAMDRLRQDEAA